VIELLIVDTRDRPIVGLEDDRGLVSVAALQVALETVVRGVELAVLEPFVERCLGLIERLGERLVPKKRFASELAPETGKVRGRSGVETVEFRFVDIGLRNELRLGFEHPAFVRYRFDRGHALGLLGNMPRAVDAFGQSV